MNVASDAKWVLAFADDLIPPSSAKTRAEAEGRSKKGPFYRPLPKEFRRGGFNYRQIYRESGFAIYRQTWKGNEHSAAFEIIRIRRREGFQIGGRFVAPGEIYPRSESWGTDGWTLQDKESAFRKLREIIAASNPLACFEQTETGHTEKSRT